MPGVWSYQEMVARGVGQGAEIAFQLCSLGAKFRCATLPGIGELRFTGIRSQPGVTQKKQIAADAITAVGGDQCERLRLRGDGDGEHDARPRLAFS